MGLGTVDLLKNAGIDPNDVVLIRHTEGKISRYQRNYLRERTAIQRKSFKGHNKAYWMTFIGEPQGRARLVALYRMTGCQRLEPDMLPDEYPIDEINFTLDYLYNLDFCDLLSDYENRLTINWPAKRNEFSGYGTDNKPIITIEERRKQSFPGFDGLITTFDELTEITHNPDTYSAYRDAMSQVSAVYLVVDTESGQQYVGSAYGEEGLWGRWSDYVNTNGEGGNKLLHDLMAKYPNRYRSLQYSVLRVLDKTTKADDVIALESLYKNKLGTRAFGLNAN